MPKKLHIVFHADTISMYRGKKRVYREAFVPVDFFANLLIGLDKRHTVLGKIARKAIAKTLRYRQDRELYRWWREEYRTPRPVCLDWTPHVHFNLLPVMAKIEIRDLEEIHAIRS